MGDSLGATLSVSGSSAGERERAPEPVLILALECDRPQAASVRYRLGGVAAVNLGRGRERAAEPSAAGPPELTIRVPDRWMSSRHARIERAVGRWVLVDTDSKNGTLVDGVSTRRTALADGALIEVGHTLFVFHERYALPMTPDGQEPADVLDLGAATLPPGATTLDPRLAGSLARLRAIAGSELAVLLEGESGTGKEVLARAVHAWSGRPGEFVAVNCGALPETLVESELFGYKKGAFSGAAADQPGLVRTADGGTLFLDEIGDLAPPSQAALLRVLQEREVTPVGGTRPIAVDLRVVAATHRDLDQMVAAGTFRQDLLARLAGFRVRVPTLAERRADLGLLIGGLHGRLFPPGHPGFDADAARLLFRYPWPLNVRELEQALAAAAVLAGTSPVRPEHLPESVRSGRPGATAKPATLSEVDAKVRDDLIEQLRAHKGNVSAVARAMDKDRKQIQRWLKRFSLDTGAFR